MNIDGLKRKEKKIFYFEGLKPVHRGVFIFSHDSATRSTVDRLKALKIKESDFFLSSKLSMLMTLCHTLIGYLTSFVTGVSQKRYFRRKGLPNLYLVID